MAQDEWRIVSVNVGQPVAVTVPGADGAQHTVVTGIFKAPVEGPVRVRLWGLEGDGQADTRVFKGRQVHGGDRKAVYIYPAAHYATWSSELQRELLFGQFGENLTVSGLLEDEIRIGDRLKVGDALLEVTEPRGPCYKLDIRMGMPEFKQQMRDTGRTGFYTSVIEPGTLQVRDEMSASRRIQGGRRCWRCIGGRAGRRAPIFGLTTDGHRLRRWPEEV